MAKVGHGLRLPLIEHDEIRFGQARYGVAALGDLCINAHEGDIAAESGLLLCRGAPGRE